MTVKKIGLLPRILLSIVLGIGFGMFLPMWCVRLFATFNALFSELLGFVIPLIILGLVSVAIADFGGKAGKMLLITAALAYGFTVLSGLFSYLVADLSFPLLIKPVISFLSMANLSSSSTLCTLPALLFTIEFIRLSNLHSVLWKFGMVS